MIAFRNFAEGLRCMTWFGRLALLTTATLAAGSVGSRSTYSCAVLLLSQRDRMIGSHVYNSHLFHPLNQGHAYFGRRCASRIRVHDKFLLKRVDPKHLSWQKSNEAIAAVLMSSWGHVAYLRSVRTTFRSPCQSSLPRNWRIAS